MKGPDPGCAGGGWWPGLNTPSCPRTWPEPLATRAVWSEGLGPPLELKARQPCTPNLCPRAPEAPRLPPWSQSPVAAKGENLWARNRREAQLSTGL